MHTQVDRAVKDAILGGEGKTADINAELVANDTRHLVDKTAAVDASEPDSGIEEEAFVHVPLHIKNAVAIAGFQPVGHRTGTLVYLNAVLIVDIAQHIIAWNGVTTFGEDILTDVLFVQEDGLLAVKLLGHDKQLRMRFILGFLCLDERHVLTPASTAGALVFLLMFALQLIHVLFAQQDGLLAQALVELFTARCLMKLRQLVGQGKRHLETILLHPLCQHLLALLLHLSLSATQDGLNLCLRLGRRHKVNPRGLHMLRFRRQHLHLVAAVQTMTQGHQLVIHLGAYAVGAEEGVDGESEVENGGVGRHGLDFALRSKDENFAGIEVKLDGVEEIHGVGLRIVENFLDGVQPFAHLVLGIFRVVVTHIA